MATYTYPGVYIEEISSGVHTITGVATSIAAFVGWAPEGPTEQATLVQSWSDFESQFGGLDSRSLLGYAVNQFFGNGGQQAYIVRLVATDAAAGAVDVPADAGGSAFTVDAIDAGGWSEISWLGKYRLLYSGLSSNVRGLVRPCSNPHRAVSRARFLSFTPDGSAARSMSIAWSSDMPASIWIPPRDSAALRNA